ncbi:MAG: NDP-sugar synthase, partial [Promethearchaeota archaeon]
MSLLKNKLNEKISVIILCAGEGKRIREFIQNVPKPLIEINNIPLLMHIISNLKIYAINSIIVITGHLGNEVKKYVNSIKKKNFSLYEKIMIIDSGENYKKGPLFSFLSIVNEKTILKRNRVYLVIPGDTFFDPEIFTEMFNTLLRNFSITNKKSIVFYQKVRSNDLKSELDPQKQ